MANLVEYVKTVWENGKTALNAARMNNMEQGISDCATQINKLGDSVSQQLPVFSNVTEKKISLNDLTKTGLYVSFTPDNAPSVYSGVWVTVINIIFAGNINYRSQLIWSNNDQLGAYRRNCANGSWREWVKL